MQKNLKLNMYWLLKHSASDMKRSTDLLAFMELTFGII